jgi:hypothetical protein
MVEGGANHKTARPFPSPFRRRYKKGGYHCDLCDCFVGWTEKSAVVHEAGKKHKQLVHAIGSIDYFDCSIGYCGLCRVSLIPMGASIDKLARQHKRGRKHQARWRELRSYLDEEIEFYRVEATAEAIAQFVSSNGLQIPDDVLWKILSCAGLQVPTDLTP